jgi:hypothetical protein
MSRSPRVTIALILEAEADVLACVTRLAAQCERSGSFGVIVVTGAAPVDETALGRRVRMVAAPADAGRTELRHLAMQHAEGDIVLIEDVECGAELSVNSGFSMRDLGDRARACAPVSEWRDILLAHGVCDVAPPRASSRAVRVGLRPAREPMPVIADLHHPA